MKATYSFVIGLVISLSLPGSAQPVQFVTVLSSISTANNPNLVLQTNQIVSLVGYDWVHKPTITGYFPDGTAIPLTLSY